MRLIMICLRFFSRKWWGRVRFRFVLIFYWKLWFMYLSRLRTGIGYVVIMRS